jgi:hypothetical protein
MPYERVEGLTRRILWTGVVDTLIVDCDLGLEVLKLVGGTEISTN